MRHLLFCLGIAISTIAVGDTTLVLTTAAGPPLTQQNQQGFCDQVVAAALARIGYNLKVSHLPAERALINANSGVDDGDLTRIGGLSRSYPNLVQVTDKTLDMEFVAFTRTANIQTSDWNSLKPYTVGIITGWKILEQNIPAQVKLTKVKNTEQLFTLLQNDRVDIILFGKWQGLSYIRKQNLEGVRMLQPALAKAEMFVYLHKKHRTLASKLGESLRDVKADGTYQRIYDKTLLPLIQ